MIPNKHTSKTESAYTVDYNGYSTAQKLEQCIMICTAVQKQYSFNLSNINTKNVIYQSNNSVHILSL